MVPVGGVRDATRPAVPLTAFDRYSAYKKDKDRIEGKCRRCCLIRFIAALAIMHLDGCKKGMNSSYSLISSWCNLSYSSFISSSYSSFRPGAIHPILIILLENS